MLTKNDYWCIICILYRTGQTAYERQMLTLCTVLQIAHHLGANGFWHFNLDNEDTGMIDICIVMDKKMKNLMFVVNI